MHKVESIADDYERKLVLKFGFLEEVLDFFRVVVIALPADTLDLPYLVRAGGSLDVFEVYFGVLAKIDNRTEIIVET